MENNYFARYASILDQVKTFNDEQILNYATTPRGVGWNSSEAQITRFDQLIKVIRAGYKETVSINDVGCGYGALWYYLNKRKRKIQYYGYDVSNKMIETARSFIQKPNNNMAIFKPLEHIFATTYSLASGLFGLRFDYSDRIWRRYVMDTLDFINAKSIRGFAFNMLTSYSEADKKKHELYYADPCMYFDLCKRRYSKNVALYHDYSLYDFTIVIRKG